MKMKFLVLIFFIFTCTVNAVEYKSAKVTRNEHVVGSNIQTGTFTTKLDHFRPQDPRTVEMVSFDESITLSQQINKIRRSKIVK